MATFGGIEHMSIAEAAEKLGISEWTIRGWVATDKVPFAREKGRVYIPSWIVGRLLEGEPVERTKPGNKVRRGRPSVLHGGQRTPEPEPNPQGDGGGERLVERTPISAGPKEEDR